MIMCDLSDSISQREETVTDKEMRACVDPEGNGATMNEGGEGGPGLPGR